MTGKPGQGFFFLLEGRTIVFISLAYELFCISDMADDSMGFIASFKKL